jgi:hypothetical protein
MIIMDPIENFLQLERRFSLSILINTHSRLSAIQLKRGYISKDDILSSLSLSGLGLRNSEVCAYYSLLQKSILISVIGVSTFQMRGQLIGNEYDFIHEMMNVLKVHANHIKSYQSYDAFQMEAVSILRANYLQSHHSYERMTPLLPAPPYTDNIEFLRHLPGSQPIYCRWNVKEDHREIIRIRSGHSPGRNEFEKAEPFVRLLAHVRKLGMDILFPQSTHDKVI